MALGLLDLPPEIRLDIYSQVLGHGDAVSQCGGQRNDPAFVSADYSIAPSSPRSAQLLRTCRTVFFEATPILYAKTTFYMLTQTFAGRLPVTLSNGNPIAAKIKHLVWQMNCDLMMHFDFKDLRIDATELESLDSLELRCSAAPWKDASCGVWCDEAAFTRGRDQMIEYAKALQTRMSTGRGRDVVLSEDTAQLRRGRVVLRLSQHRR